MCHELEKSLTPYFILLTIDFNFRFVSSQCVVKLYFRLIVYLLCTAVSGS